MRKRGAYAVLAGVAPIMVCTLSSTAFVKEERIPAGKTKLNFTSDIQVGENRGSADIALEDGECSVEGVDIINRDDTQVDGDKPKVEAWFSTDSDYYFKKSGKSAFSLPNDTIKYASGSTKNDRKETVLVVKLDKLGKDDEDLDVSGLMWNKNNGMTHWDDISLTKNYEVHLYWRGGNSYEDNIDTTYTMKRDSYDFSGKFPKAGTYYPKVRVTDFRNNVGDWQESPYLEITEEDLTRANGQWFGDDRDQWYQKGDGTYPSNGWLYINYEWYFFDQGGYIKTGWISWEDKLYYCDPSGAMSVSMVTPDGPTVGADRVRLGQ